MRVRRHPKGFTLIELLVVIAIIAVLIGLLLPAVQKVRAAAARAQCQNNLKQIALAVHEYHDAKGFFPSSAGPGAGYNYNPTSPYCWSWLAMTLPYLEQGNLYTSAGIPAATMDQAGTYAAAPVKSLFCPSDITSNGLPRTDEANIGSSFNYGGPPVPVGQTNYKGVCGNNWEWSSNPAWNNYPQGNGNGLDAGNGIFYRSDGAPNTGGHGPLKMTNITDGTSNTFLIGEDIPSMNVHCDWPFFNHAVGTCAIAPNSGMLAGQPGFENPTDWPDLYSFRSYHPNGLQFAMADGSVHFIQVSIALQTYWALASYNGGEVASLP